MQEVFEKIIEKLEERKHLHNRMIDYENKNGTVSGEFQQRKAVEVLDYAIKIVNQAAEEYNNVMIDGKYCFQNCACTEQCDKCSRLCNGDTDWYENIDNWVEEFVPDTNVGSNGWIPVSEQLPDEAFGCLVTVMDYEPSTQTEFENILPYFVGYDGHGWNNAYGEEITFEVIAWKKLPTPYHSNGENHE